MDASQIAQVRKARHAAALLRCQRLPVSIGLSEHVMAELIEGDHAEALDDPRQRVPHACLTDEQWATARARGLM